MRFSGQVKKVTNRANKKARFESEYIDFDNPNVEPLATNDAVIKIKHKPKTIDRFMKTMPLMEMEMKNFTESLFENEMRPGTFIKGIQRRKALKENKENAEKIQPYHYENPADRDYCSQNTDNHFDDGDSHHDNDDEGMLTHEEVVKEDCLMADNLIKAPELVPKTYVPYALQAKKMDMKKLKSNMWTILTREKGDGVTPTTFKEVYKELPSHFGGKMKEELSAPLAFVALLHLANEHNLQLAGQEDLKNFLISGPR